MSKFESEVREFFEKNREIIGADARVWTKAEWARRDEKYGNEAPFVVTFEGPMYEAFNYGTIYGYSVDIGTKFCAIAEKHGYYFEPAYGWMIIPVR